ncbi:MAG: hypothetical protein AAF340_15585 [Pseudomonadota bacterium]
MEQMTTGDVIFLSLALFCALVFLVFWRLAVLLSRERRVTMDQSREGLVSDAQVIGGMGLFLLGGAVFFAALASYFLMKAFYIGDVFSGNDTLFGILLFYVDQSLKGLLGDLLEVFDVTVPGAARLNPQANVFFSMFIVIFRAFVAGVALLAVFNMFQERRQELVFEINGNRLIVDRRSLMNELTQSPAFFAMLQAREAGLDGTDWRARVDEIDQLFVAADFIGPVQPLAAIRGGDL